MAASVLGMAFAWARDHRVGGDSPFAAILRGAALPVVAVAAAGVFWLASVAQDDDHALTRVEVVNHLQPEDQLVAALPEGADTGGATTNHGDHSHDAATDPEAMGEGNAHTHGTEVPVTPEQLKAAAEFYDHVKADTAKYEDIRVALRDGYVQITQDLPGIAAHFVNPKYNKDGDLMNPAQPEVLLYTKRLDGNWRLVGAMFTSETPSETPPSFFGPLDAWHRHENLCFTAGAQVMVKPSQAQCPGIFQETTAWNLHVWTAPGASGVFAHDFPPIDPGAYPGATRPAATELFAARP
ncbi:MAG: hypothetical protein ACM3S1_07900 [Hyphomicrobiales bacterium]